MQVSLTAFSPVDSVWRDLVLATDGAVPKEQGGFEFTAEVKRRFDPARHQGMVDHICRHNCIDPGRAPSIFEAFCRLKFQDPARPDLPTLCRSQFFPWCLCPLYVARVKGVTA